MNLFLWTTHLSSSHFSTLEALRRQGFGLVEIPVSDYGPNEIRQIAECLKQLDLSCTTATLLTAEHNPIDPSARVRQRALDKLKSDIDLSAALGSQALIGPMHSAHKQFWGRGPSIQEFDWCVETLRAAADYAAKAGVELSVEFLNRFECYFLNTTAQAAALVDAVNHPALGVLYDTHHANIEESDITTALLAHARHINHVHISESHRGTPGTGTVDWPTTFSALQRSAYQGRLVIEAFGSQVAEIVSAVNIWRDCFDSPEQVYQEGWELISQSMTREAT